MQGARATEVASTCNKVTGGGCSIFGCAETRNAACEKGACVCGEGMCADNGVCVPEAEYDPTESCENSKPCSCSLGSQVLQTPICLNYMQCGSRVTPGICGDAGVKVNFSLKLDGLTTEGTSVKATKFKCCLTLKHDESEAFLAAMPEHLKTLPADQPGPPVQPMAPYHMISIQGTGGGLFFSGVFVGTAFVAPWFVLAFIGAARYCRAKTPLDQHRAELLG